MVSSASFHHVDKDRHTTDLHLETCKPASLAHADNKNAGKRTATQATFLPASAENGFEPHTRPATNVRGTNTLRPIYLMPRYAHEVDVHLIDVEWDLAECLCRVGMKVNATVTPDEGTDFPQGLNDTGLVVDRHDRDERGIRSDGIFKLFQ